MKGTGPSKSFCGRQEDLGLLVSKIGYNSFLPVTTDNQNCG